MKRGKQCDDKFCIRDFTLPLVLLTVKRAWNTMIEHKRLTIIVRVVLFLSIGGGQLYGFHIQILVKSEFRRLRM